MTFGEYVKEHPWATGIIVVIGGLIFFMIVRGGGSSGGESGGGVSRPSDAEIAANATITSAQINAQAQASQANAAVQATQIGAGVQMNSDNKAAEVAMYKLAQDQSIQSQYLSGQAAVAIHQIDSNQQVANTVIGATSSKNAKNNNVASILASVATGQPVYYQPPQRYAGDTPGGIISSIGGLASSIGSIFSDQRLKENIRFLGYNEKGLEVYEWNYKGSRRKHVGYIAQSVKRSNPEAVSVDSGTGYWKVNTLALASI